MGFFRVYVDFRWTDIWNLWLMMIISAGKKILFFLFFLKIPKQSESVIGLSAFCRVLKTRYIRNCSSSAARCWDLIIVQCTGRPENWSMFWNWKPWHCCHWVVVSQKPVTRYFINCSKQCKQDAETWSQYSVLIGEVPVLCVGRQVLKALALLRLGRQDESSVLLEEVHSQHPIDDATLQAMSICYREVHKRKCPVRYCT